MSQPILACRLGRVRYQPAYALQHVVAELRAEDKLPDTLLLLEHEPVYTLGRRGSEGEILLDADECAARGIEVVRTEGGVLVSYHGPGQLVGYPIFWLGGAPDVRGYVCRLENAMIGAAKRFDVVASRSEGLPGIWVGDAKLGAIGVHVARGITTHGFALNVAPDLSAFNGIVPCGVMDKGVTSLAELTGRDITMDQAIDAIVGAFGEAFDRPVAFAELNLEGAVHGD